MTAIEILRAASRSVPNEDYVQFMAAVDAVAGLVGAAEYMLAPAYRGPDQDNLRAALANVGGAA